MLSPHFSLSTDFSSQTSIIDADGWWASDVEQPSG